MINNKQQKLYSSKFSDQIMNIAYSTLGLAPANTAEHFQIAAHMGFNAIKGDVRITSDNGLVMCHDAGVTLDCDGRITTYDSENEKKFVELKFEDVMRLEYNMNFDTMGHYAKVCDFDTFIRICKENGKVAYVTLRENKIPMVVAEVMKVLRKYSMEDECVINSFTYEVLQEVRKYSDTIPVSNVIDLGIIPGRDVIDCLKSLGNAILTMFLYPAEYYPIVYNRSENPAKLWEQAADTTIYACENNIPIHMAQVKEYSDYRQLISSGVQGIQILNPFVPYLRKDVVFKVILCSGEILFENFFSGGKLSAEVEMKDGVVEIKNITNYGNGYGYDDGLPVLWLNCLPFNLSVSCETNAECSICFKNNMLLLDTKNIDGTYCVNVNI